MRMICSGYAGQVYGAAVEQGWQTSLTPGKTSSTSQLGHAAIWNSDITRHSLFAPSQQGAMHTVWYTYIRAMSMLMQEHGNFPPRTCQQ